MGIFEKSTNKDYYKPLRVRNVHRCGKKTKNDSFENETLHNKIVKNVERKKGKEEELINRFRYIRNLFGEGQHIRIKPIENSDGTYIQYDSDDDA